MLEVADKETKANDLREVRVVLDELGLFPQSQQLTLQPQIEAACKDPTHRRRDRPAGSRPSQSCRGEHMANLKESQYI